MKLNLGSKLLEIFLLLRGSTNGNNDFEVVDPEVFTSIHHGIMTI
jgi:hypothetical protein